MHAAAMKKQVDIAIICEPNLRQIEGRKWHVDTRKDAAIGILSNNITLGNSGGGNGYVWLEIGELVVYSCYISPNCNLQDCETWIVELADNIKRHNKQSLVAGDFNAKAPEWGSNVLCPKGDILTDIMAHLQLTLVNDGKTPTMVRSNAESYLDLTWTSERLSLLITDWCVIEDEESLSDHRHITYQVISQSHASNAEEASESKRWKIKALNKQVLLQEIRQRKENMVNADQLASVITAACEKAMRDKTSSKEEKKFTGGTTISPLSGKSASKKEEKRLEWQLAIRSNQSV